MTRKRRIGCLAVIVYWIACIAALEFSGQGFWLGMAHFSTIQGGWLSREELIFSHALDAVTAPVQVTVGWPCVAIKHIYDNTGERLKRKETLKAEAESKKRYAVMLDEDPTLMFSLPDFASSSNRIALAALNDWIARQWIYDKVDEEWLEKCADFIMGHRDVMPYIESLWRAPKMRPETEIRALQVAVDLAADSASPHKELQWLLQNMMRATAGDEWQPPIIPDGIIEQYLNHPVAYVSECAREELRYRRYMRSEKKRIDEYLRKAKGSSSSPASPASCAER